MSDELTFLRTEPGRVYLLEVMEKERGLCETMRKTVAEGGDVYALVPEGSTVERVGQFEAGGLLSATAAENLFLERIVSRGNVGRPGVLLVQDLWATPTDYPNVRAVPNYSVKDDSVYLWAYTNQVEDLRACLRHPISFNFIAYLVPDRVVAQQFCDGLITADALAPAIPEIYSPAYDQESFVSWSRTG